MKAGLPFINLLLLLAALAAPLVSYLIVRRLDFSAKRKVPTGIVVAIAFETAIGFAGVFLNHLAMHGMCF